ncbi:MAG: 4-hydroxy-3-polyprenylbenzoate decarboxylase [Planctomycetota bacterium]|jgi:4-hydroxy-3-polyprenylbenzoate decarboxylase
MKRIFVGITGASGHRYAEGLIRSLRAADYGVDLSITPAGCKVLKHELGVDAGPGGERLQAALPGWLGEHVAREVRVFLPAEVGAPAASGSAGVEAVVLAPCSMGSLARVAAGFSSNLVERAADVALKEGRPLLLMPRETPLSVIHLENMLRLAKLGAVILPCMPGFYHGPESIDDLVEHVVSKLLDRLGVERRGAIRWAGLEEPPTEPGTESPTESSGEPRP